MKEIRLPSYDEEWQEQEMKNKESGYLLDRLTGMIVVLEVEIRKLNDRLDKLESKSGNQ